MAAESARRRRPRIRQAPSVRQQIEESAQKTRPERRRSSLTPAGSAVVAIFSLFKKILSPLAPIGRPIGRVLGRLMPRYFTNSWKEVKQVSWPNRRETWRLTGAVLVFSIVFGALIAVVDKGLSELFERVILR